MLLRTIVIAALVGAATVAANAATATDPKVVDALALKRALQPADFLPAKVERTLFGAARPTVESQDNLNFIGKDLHGANYSYKWKTGEPINVPGLGPTDKEWHVTGDVFIAPTVAAAKQLYADGKAAGHGFFADFGTDNAKTLTIPTGGDESFALLAPDVGPVKAGGSHAMVFVRKGATVWELSVGHSPPQWKVTDEEVVAILSTYAHKQSKRATLN